MSDILFQNLKIKEYKNNFRLIVRTDKSLPVTALQLWIKVGSLDETEKNNGISHFLEHMLFKGTKKYKTGEISKIIESYGGVINASTGKEFTNYSINIPKEGLKDALDILYEMAFNATFPEDEFISEKLVVLEEIKRAEDYPETSLYQNFIELLYTETNYKYRVIGTTTSVENITRDEMITFYKTYYSPNNMVLVIVGDVDYHEIKDEIEKFTSYPPKPIPERKKLCEKLKQENIIVNNKQTENARIICGFLGPDIDSQFLPTVDVLSTIMGSGRASRLYRKLREEKKIVFTVSSGFHTQIGNGMFYITAICQEDLHQEVLNEIKKEIDEIIKKGVKKAELNRAKEMILIGDIFSHQTFHEQASTLAWWGINKKLKSLRKYLRNIKKVNPQQIKKFLTQYYSGLSASIILPLK